ncbi:hypothetical protein FXW26_03595 [Candidatus Liberibacter asiaticus]|nr:hypothetical protein FXW26_03595 [Candidatus Liberibacter asiaticus]
MTGSIRDAFQLGKIVANRDKARAILIIHETSTHEILEGNSVNKYASVSNITTPSVCKKNFLIASTLQEIKIPTIIPIPVPAIPIKAPIIKNMLIMEEIRAPIVRKIAISRRLSCTNMTKLDIMLRAATKTINARITNIALLSTFIAEKKI